MSAEDNIGILWNEFSSCLRSFILSKIKNESDADDILQDAYLKIHNNINNLKDHTRLKAWVYQITRNLIYDYFRAQKYTEDDTLLSDLITDSFPDNFMDVAIDDMIKMMEELSPEYCQALCMTEIEGMDQKEYAEKTGQSYSGARSRVQRARKMLKDMLLNCCHYQFDKYGTVIDIQPKCCCCIPEKKI